MWENPPRWYDMKENLALDKYKDNVFPGSLLIGINAGPKTDICAEDNDGEHIPPPPISRPFENAELFKATPSAASPPPPSDDNDEKQNFTQIVQQKPKEQKKKKMGSHANVTIQCIQACDLVSCMIYDIFCYLSYLSL